MFEKFTSGNIESFRQRYEGTYGFYRDESKKRLLVKLTEVRESRCTFVNADGIEFHLNSDSARDIGFEFLPPRSAWYNTQEGAYYTERVASRQFQRGITGKNVLIHSLLGHMTPARVDFGTLSMIFDSKPFDMEASLDTLKKGRSLAISPQFALDPATSQIYLFGDIIGTYKQDKQNFQFKLNEPGLWKTEITDALRAINCTTEIAANG